MHRKPVVVDAETAFIGGINHSADHLASFGELAKQDYAVLLRGPVVARIHTFCRRQADPSPAARGSWWSRRSRHRRAPRVHPGEQGWAAFVVRDNGLHRHDIERQYRLALRSARSQVSIAKVCFFPGQRLLRGMRRAAPRGVRVELILQGRPDIPIAKVAVALAACAAGPAGGDPAAARTAMPGRAGGRRHAAGRGRRREPRRTPECGPVGHVLHGPPHATPRMHRAPTGQLPSMRGVPSSIL